MSVQQFHPGPNASVRRGQETSILAICDTYIELANTPLKGQPLKLERLRRTLRIQKKNLEDWISMDLLSEDNDI